VLQFKNKWKLFPSTRVDMMEYFLPITLLSVGINIIRGNHNFRSRWANN